MISEGKSGPILESGVKLVANTHIFQFFNIFLQLFILLTHAHHVAEYRLTGMHCVIKLMIHVSPKPVCINTMLY